MKAEEPGEKGSIRIECNLSNAAAPFCFGGERLQGRPGGPALKPRASGGLPDLQEGDPAILDDELSDGLHLAVLVDVGAYLEVAMELEPIAFAGSEGATLRIETVDPAKR